jgi:hypothetical protein
MREEFGIIQADVNFNAYKGEGAWVGRPFLGLRSSGSDGDVLKFEQTVAKFRGDKRPRHCQLNGPRAPFFGPARLERDSTIGEQRTFRPEPPRHRHYKHTTGG